MAETTEKLVLEKGEKYDLHTLQRILTKSGELVPVASGETHAEDKFIELMERHGIKVIPQWRVDKYLFDFKVSEAPILIEIDGGVHNKAQQRQRDYMKDRLAHRKGFVVLRFTNAEVHDGQQGGGSEEQFIRELRINLSFVRRSPREVILKEKIVIREVGLYGLVKRWLGKDGK